MADETTIVEPKIDSHETEEQTNETPVVGADKTDEVETVDITEQEQEAEQEHTESNESNESAAESHGVTDDVAAIDAFVAEPQDEASHDVETTPESAVDATEDQAVPEAEAEVEVKEEHTEEHVQEELSEEHAHADATEEDMHAAHDSEHDSILERDAESEHEEEEHQEHSQHDEHDEHDEHEEHSEHELYEEHESFAEHSEADHSFAESADAHSERTGSALSHHEDEAHNDYEGHEEYEEHEEPIHEDYAVEDENHDLHDEEHASVHGDEHEEHQTAHDRLQEALANADTGHTTEDTRRGSTSSSRSGGSARRTSMRTEALIQAAARAVVAKINGHEAESADFDILSSINESQTVSEGRQSDAHSEARSARSARSDSRSEAAAHSTTDEEVDYEYDGEMGDNDDVFSNRSHRTSLGSFEHNSGVSNSGSEYDHQKKDGTSRSIAEAANTLESETEQEDDYAADTGCISYHENHRSPRMSTMSTMSKGPRISDVTGISHMSHYDDHHRDEEENYHDGDDYIPHTIRGAPRPAFRTPSSVRAIQMSSPSPSVIFGVSPRSAARRRRVGTGEGVDAGQSMGSVATYSSLPNSPSKRSTPTRFKVFRRPEPAPLVLLHATIMPTRWGWSDVLRDFDEMMSHAPPKQSTRSSLSDRKDEHSVGEDIPTDLSSFEPSAALNRLHNTWCQLQEYSLGADTVTERGVLLPHPQNDYEVLEERLLEALELPVRRRARILECGHYLGPADDDDDDDDDDEDYDYDDDENEDDNDEDGSSKRHWCSTCRSDIRYESLGAERVFRVKVYASNGLMTVGAWDACWREMERVDVEIEPIVADPALQRELNLLRNLQQQDVYRRQLEEEERNAMHHEEEEEQHDEHEEHDDIVSEQSDSHHDQHLDHPELHEHQDPRGAVDQFHLVSSSSTPVPPALHDSPVEPPATTPTDHDPDADFRKRAAEDRLREIYGSTPPQSIPRTMSLPPQMEPTPSRSATPGTTLAMTHHSIHNQHSAYGPSPPSPSADAYERREDRHYRQYSYPGPSDRADRGFEYGGPAPTYPPHQAGHNGNYHHGHPRQPYESASLPELLMAAVKVFLRDRKHVAITVLSVIVIVLATLRAPAASVDGTTVAPLINNAAPPKAVVQQPIVESHELVSVATTTATVFHTVENPAASVVAKIDTQVETVVEKMTVKVYETVTETATEVATTVAIETSTETPITTATQAATAAITETADAESIESTPIEEAVEAPEATKASSAEEPEETTKATETTGAVFFQAQQTCSAYDVVSVEES
ncbi:pathway-specific nitrogen regulator [Ophiostoma piceae UAMH 11346]|uniref:Pathway-specific nitrogen regulator n=1 Tax=Ophiostoma piceae (strain UAMH 11346) TaxID=1262450 RepID=S3C4C8_OPHP1|nr:pathway-specific nitrogen regulator [Ophiostoma piceae UAMH 11346]